MTSNKPEDFLLGALIGSAIGAAAALVFAPVSGNSLRRSLTNGFKMPFRSVKKHTISSKLNSAAAKLKKAAPKVAKKSMKSRTHRVSSKTGHHH
jgi:gas vesicle protein